MDVPRIGISPVAETAGLKRRGRVGENQIHAVGGKLAGDGDTGRRVARGVLLVELDVRHFLGQRVLKALRRGIQRLR